jgi:fructosamine-3-kinase
MEIEISSFAGALAENLQRKFENKLEILDIREIGGGSINTALLVKTNQGEFFAKYNDGARYKGMFEAEARNLGILAQSRALYTPSVLATFSLDNNQFLVLEYIESGTPHYDFWRDFGTGLARLHKNTSATFGLEYDNFVGSLPQVNTPKANWVDFFISNRLDPQLKMAVDSGKADADVVKRFESLYNKLPDIFPTEHPALLHGDLWSGNCMADYNGEPVIYDPAIYFGHREMDLAMSRLFGGFEREFYEAYNEEYPLEKHWEQRISICNLYPLLVHVNLFVGSYIQSVKNIISRY